MSQPKIYEVLADVFAAEGVTTHFTLMGNGNMYFVDTLAKRQRIRNIHVRHEHCAVAMAEGYARFTGDVGVASVTCGPGFTQVMTALTIATRASMPLVVFSADAPMSATFHVHQIDQAPLALATGAHYIAVRSKDRMLRDIRDAFYIARTERRPVVVNVPEDFQQQPFDFTGYTPSTAFLPRPQRVIPDPGLVEEAADMIAASKFPIFIAGRGATRAEAATAIAALADASGALLATTLYAKGLFDSHPFGVDVAGGFSTDLARELFAKSDLVIGFGAILGHHTTDGGSLYPNAKTIQIDVNPRGLSQGLRVADLHLRSDARLGAEALLARLRDIGCGDRGIRTPDLRARIAGEIPDRMAFPIPPGTVDPRKALVELDAAIPKDWDVVVGSGHFFTMAMTHLKNRPPDRYHVITEFGAIGSALATAIGIAVARGDGKVALIEGDGSLLMHIQELDTISRHGIRMLICIMNDGGYGAEVHKFHARNMDPSESVHGRRDLGGVSQAFGLRGATVNAPGAFAGLFERHAGANQAELWDIHIADNIASAPFRRMYFKAP